MTQEKNDRGFEEKEKVKVVPTRKGEELHFAIVEVDGKVRGDIRFFVKNKDGKGMFAARRGVSILPRNFKDFQEGVNELAKKLSEYNAS